ncbi:Multidrug resistance protein MdtE precursor [Edwardsiella tarda]|nr:Multidrug resistance protein MdtE precursor [Edwardsiella tarda]
MNVMSALTSRRARRIGFSLLLIALFLFAWRQLAQPNTPASSSTSQPGAKRANTGPRGNGQPVPIQAASVRSATIDSYLDGLGTVVASNTVTVRSRVDGQLMKLHFTEGQQVQAGDLLAEIDPRPFQIQLQQAQGALARDQALLDNARRDLARYQRLAKDNLVSRQELDHAGLAGRSGPG